MGTSEYAYDIEGFANELETDMETIAGLFSSYFTEMKGEISSMQTYLSAKDWVMLERVIHNIKGVSANLGINDVFSEAEKFDILLKKGENSNADIFVEGIAVLISNAEGIIREIFLKSGIELDE